MNKWSDPREATYQSIRRMLLDGRIRSRKDLSRRKLASDLRVQPGIVQWALVRLEADKVVESRPQSGTFVRQLDPREFRRRYRLRLLLEPYAAGRAARWITAEQLASLEIIWQEMIALQEKLKTAPSGQLPVDFVERDVRLEFRFHGTILEAAHHPEAAEIVENLLIPIFHYVDTNTRAERRLVDDVRQRDADLIEHRNILDALHRGDAAQARRLMRNHLRSGLTMKSRKRDASRGGA